MSSLEGQIDIGILSGWIPPSLIAARLAKFQSRYPRIKVRLSTLPQDGLESELISEKLTFAVSADVFAGRAANEFITIEASGDMPLVAVATAAYIAKHGPFERPEKLLLADVVEVGETYPILTRWALSGDIGLQAVLTQTSPSLTVPDHDAALSVIKSGHGWGFVPLSLAKTAIGNGGLKEIAVKPVAPTFKMQLLYRRKRTRSLADSVFLEFWLEEKP